MSLLEDVFLQDEADEAQDLERIIEGDEYEARRSDEDDDDGGPRDDEAEEDKRRVDPSSDKPKRVIKNPRFTLNPARLTGPRGIQVIPEHFKNFKFKGKGHEKEDLDVVLKTLEHWAYRLYPKFKFPDCLKKIETLGKKRPVMVQLMKIRSDQFLEDPVVQQESSDDEPAPVDEFDVLLQQQIDNSTMATPARKDNSTIATPARKTLENNIQDIRTPAPLLMPKATSSPSISEQQKERMLKNRRLAEEKRLARLANVQAIDNVNQLAKNPINEEDENDDLNISKHRNTNVIQSDDSDEEMQSVHESTTVDVHLTENNENVDKNNKKTVKLTVDDFDRIDDDVNINNTNNFTDTIEDDYAKIIDQDNNKLVENKFDKILNTNVSKEHDVFVSNEIKNNNAENSNLTPTIENDFDIIANKNIPEGDNKMVEDNFDKILNNKRVEDNFNQILGTNLNEIDRNLNNEEVDNDFDKILNTDVKMSKDNCKNVTENNLLKNKEIKDKFDQLIHENNQVDINSYNTLKINNDTILDKENKPENNVELNDIEITDI